MFPEGLAYIGGIAVYLHLVNSREADFAEFTHEGDFYISLADMEDLRDKEDVTANRRLSKHQLIRNGFEFDIYTESHSKLIVPYDAVMSRSVTVDVIRVESLEHLLSLKLEAYSDRRNSAKGEKDAKDIVRIGIALQSRSKEGKPFDPKLVIPYLRDDHLQRLAEVEKSTASLSICKGNAHKAKGVRGSVSAMQAAIHEEFSGGGGGNSKNRPEAALSGPR